MCLDWHKCCDKGVTELKGQLRLEISHINSLPIFFNLKVRIPITNDIPEDFGQKNTNQHHHYQLPVDNNNFYQSNLVNRCVKMRPLQSI
jgi:hypothetical protein